MNKRPLAVIAILFIIGIVLAGFLPGSIKFPHVFVITLIFILFSFIFSRYQKISNIPLLLLITSFASLLYLNSNIFPNNHISNFLGEERLKTSVVGVIKSPALTRKPYFGKINSTYVLEIEAVKDNGEWFGVNGLSQIRIQTEEDYGYGDRLLVRGAVKKPRNVGADLRVRPNDSTGPAHRPAPTVFDYRAYLERQNIFALINTKEHDVTLLAHDYKSNPILKYIYSIRERLKNQIIAKMPLDSGAFLRAILLGDRSELPKHIQTSFKNSGTMHILAISGLHVGIIALVIVYLLRLLRVGRGFSYAFTILFLIFFALLTLSRPSVVRATVMACVFLVGMLLGRRVDLYNSLGIAAIFILARNPKDLFNVGFQLSFFAVLSILYFVPKLMRLATKEVSPCIRKYLYIPLAVSASAWLGTFPLILYYFRIITPVSIISNFFIIPVLFALLIGGLGFVLLGWLPFAGIALANFNNLCSHIIFSLADFFASLRLGHFPF